MYCANRCTLLGLTPTVTRKQLAELARKIGFAESRLGELLRPGRRPLRNEISLLTEAFHLPEESVRIAFDAIDIELADAIAKNAINIARMLSIKRTPASTVSELEPAFSTSLGDLYQADCLDLLRHIPSDSVDLVFADPPFNLNKTYSSNIDDDLKETEYLHWCEAWIEECCRVLRPGGSMFVWNIPKWSTHISGMLNSRVTFRHWIAVDVKYSLPISGRLYPSHYGLLYYTKAGAQPTFHPDRLPMLACPKCGADLKDYGGYKSKMNPLGISLSDVWYDISPVRHTKYKKRKEANELPIRLLDRILELASNEGDLVFDPFGGAGTTFAVAEMKGRRWIGTELGPVEQVKERFTDLSKEKEYLDSIRSRYNKLFADDMYVLRKARGLWTCDDFHGEPEKEMAGGGSLF